MLKAHIKVLKDRMKALSFEFEDNEGIKRQPTISLREALEEIEDWYNRYNK